MGCLCSKATWSNDFVVDYEREKEKESRKSSVQLVPPKEEFVAESRRGSVHRISNENVGSVRGTKDGEDRIVERPKSGHHKRTGSESIHGRISSNPGAAEGEATEWPSWLISVAKDAVHGWTPRSADSYEKLKKIGQGTYSSVYKARDLKTNKIVAMKKVRFVNMDPESVRFMAREICILRRLDHPNVMRLEAIVTSRMSDNLYLVFEYMEHDLTGLLASPDVKFTVPQIKCYMQQLLSGLEHCHRRGVLHRDIKGSNLLIDNKGVLKIGDFGLATFFNPDKKQLLTSRVVTLWYRAPELLLGATSYGAAIDMWSVGCILAELFVGKPIMPGRTEVEQMHKIFKLCGSPSEQYWKKTKLPHATSFKPQQPYKRQVAETFKDLPSSALELVDVLLSVEPEARSTASSALKSEFFTTAPLPCDPSSLPKYAPSKEYDAKLREEKKRRKVESVKGRGPESVRRGHRELKENDPTPEFMAHGQQVHSNKCASVAYKPHGDAGAGFPLEPSKGLKNTGINHSTSMVHPSAAVSWSAKAKDETGVTVSGRTNSSIHRGSNLRRQHSHKNEKASSNDNMGQIRKKSRILCSGPLVPAGGSMEDLLKEHEKHIQDAVRKARLDKDKSKKNLGD
ncbi:probable serine/threonine-protein kinase At1g09600 isoform X1 [Daucus carota subsp. sativus]|uniref:Protein kinase domain-containing protein n=1 Tax=Daucus carota subsp. sativus TaxID=79200 RepID=A0A166I8H7_DAUCS|nr:PREDICTED: probable serine/threonine-protein kinase At1g09600 [Daucus carota subsp. sativus]